jgi:hypothetical protein
MARRCHWLKVIQLILNWRQTSTGLHRSVHTASTAWVLSSALGELCGSFFFSLGVLSFVITGLVEVIDQFLLFVLFVADTEFEFALLGAEHDGLTVHAADHVEGGLRFAAQGQFQQIFLDAGLDGFAQRRLDFEEAIGRTEPFNTLMRSLVVVILDPEFDPLASRLEAIELSAGEELLPDAFPEALDLAQRHRMLGAAFEVSHTIFFKFGLEAAGAAPRSILAAIVSEHLLGRLKLTGRHSVDFDHRLSRGTAE